MDNRVKFIKDVESFSDVYLLPLNGGQPTRISADCSLAPIGMMMAHFSGYRTRGLVRCVSEFSLFFV
jgi:hypothetical protein